MRCKSEKEKRGKKTLTRLARGMCGSSLHLCPPIHIYSLLNGFAPAEGLSSSLWMVLASSAFSKHYKNVKHCGPCGPSHLPLNLIFHQCDLCTPQNDFVRLRMAWVVPQMPQNT